MTCPPLLEEDDMPTPSGHDTPRRTVHVIDRSGWGTGGAYPAIRALRLIWTPHLPRPAGNPTETPLPRGRRMVYL